MSSKHYSQKSSLNPAQQKAVQTTEGKVLILAGAGSGKTSVLINRIVYLLEEQQTDPSSILGLTFTNKAALEMKERIAAKVPRATAKALTLSTFHSFCMQVLRKHIPLLGYTKNFTLYDEKEVKRLSQNLARNLLEHEGELPSLEKVLEKISYAKSRGVELKDLEKEKQDPFSIDLFTRLQSCMRAYNAVDFDSLLSLTVQLFEEQREILDQYQERYRYIMIDEYQDTSPIQYRLAQLLSQKHGNLCVVGDDDQSIYGWRGAEIKNILQFDADTRITLEQNYRSTPTILAAANAIIAHNTQRHQKKLWSAQDSGDLITLFHAPGELEEAQSVIQRMVQLRKEKNIPWKEMAILYRSNALSRPFEFLLTQSLYQAQGKWVRGIPFEVFGGTPMYQRAEVKDFIAYLRVIDNPLDQEALLRIINVPRRGISDQTLDRLTQINRTQNLPLWSLLQQIASPLSSDIKNDLSSKAIQAISSFVQLIENAQNTFATLSLHEACVNLIETIDYKKAILEDVKSDKMREFKWENIESCIDAVTIYETDMSLNDSQGEISLSHFLSSCLLDPEQMQRQKGHREDRVSLMTFHSAKGLEFTACYLVGLEDHIIPHEKSLAETGLEEERRLMYVAMTRAKERLTLSMARNRKRHGKEMASSPSRFLFEIPKELIQITSWQTTA